MVPKTLAPMNMSKTKTMYAQYLLSIPTSRNIKPNLLLEGENKL